MISELDGWPANPPHGRSDQIRCRIQPSAGGRSDELNLLRRTLSFPIPIRFIPAHPDPFSPYAALLLTHVVTIGVAGVVSNVRLFRLLAHICGCRRQALQVLGAWLAGNAVLVCQLSWNLRPFMGKPDLPVTLFREHPFAGNFIEALIEHAASLFTT